MQRTDLNLIVENGNTSGLKIAFIEALKTDGRYKNVPVNTLTYPCMHGDYERINSHPDNCVTFLHHKGLSIFSASTQIIFTGPDTVDLLNLCIEVIKKSNTAYTFSPDLARASGLFRQRFLDEDFVKMVGESLKASSNRK